jgi:tetratricopeptide (TPR) repeat protein
MTKHFALGIAALFLAAGAGCTQEPYHPQAAITGGPNDSTAADAIKNVAPTANTHFAAGQLAESQGDLPNAIDQYKTALKIDPHNANSQFRLAVIYTGLKQYDNAVSEWNKYLKLTDNSAAAYSNLAFCEEIAGRPVLAETYYQRGIVKDPNNESCRINYGYMLARHDRTNEAYLQFAAVLPPAQAHYDLGTVYESKNRKEEAKAEYKKAAELDPDLTDAAEKLAMLSKD